MSEQGTTKDQLHPVQSQPRDRKPATAPVAVTMRAYEVYCHVHGPQPALVTGWCRGGFSAGELIAFLYAHTFPKEEWRARADEAFRGLNV
jgi:ribonuclease PH